ncbi:MAG: hypothetical protein NW237_17235 [Cyanobacteriota bacterium]|nr:hypothetical protein [Cyanobacteriota bacterium]
MVATSEQASSEIATSQQGAREMVSEVELRLTAEHLAELTPAQRSQFWSALSKLWHDHKLPQAPPQFRPHLAHCAAVAADLAYLEELDPDAERTLADTARWLIYQWDRLVLLRF